MKASGLPERSIKALSSVFDIDEDVSPSEVTDIKAFLVQQITRLLDNNPGKLMSILYRIDVLEHHVKNAFETAPNGELASTLADLIIDRQLQKQKYRKKGY